MPKHLKTQFVIADGVRARWVKRSDHADDFVTERQIEAEPRPSGNSQGAAVEGYTGHPFSMGEHFHAERHLREQFAHEVAEEINTQASKKTFDRLAVIAPARVLNVIHQRLSTMASAKLFKTLAKDLTKVPDHELGAWLRDLEFG